VRRKLHFCFVNLITVGADMTRSLHTHAGGMHAGFMSLEVFLSLVVLAAGGALNVSHSKMGALHVVSEPGLLAEAFATVLAREWLDLHVDSLHVRLEGVRALQPLATHLTRRGCHGVCVVSHPLVMGQVLSQDGCVGTLGADVSFKRLRQNTVLLHFVLRHLVDKPGGKTASQITLVTMSRVERVEVSP